MRIRSLFAVSLLLTSCADITKFNKYSFTMTDWEGQIHEDYVLKEADINHWWRDFNDPVLNKLVERLIEQNLDLKIAEARIKESRSYITSSRADLLPSLSLLGNASRETSKQLMVKDPHNVSNIGFDTSWELDIFGKNREAFSSAKSLFLSNKSSFVDTKLSVTAELIKDYMVYRANQQQIAITEGEIYNYEETKLLNDSLYQAGLKDNKAVLQAESNLRVAISKLEYYKAQLNSSKHSIELLLNEKPGAIDDVLEQAEEMPEYEGKVLVTTPARLITTRPDVLAAKYNFESAVSIRDSAFAEQFPNISLGAFFGIQDGTVVKSGSIWSLAANLAMPIFNWGKIQANIEAKDAQAEQAFYNYQKAVISAVHDVQTSLSDYMQSKAKEEQLEEAYVSLGEAMMLTEARYEAGIESYFAVIEASQNLLTIAEELNQAMLDTNTNLAKLYKSLGRE